MVTGWLRAIPILVLLTAAAPAAAAGPSPPFEPVNREMEMAAATVDAFHAALRRGDTLSALFLLAENALVLEEGRAERSKSEYAAKHVGADAAFSQAVPGVVTNRRGDAVDGLAWIATEGRTKGKYRGTEVNRATAETMVLRRIGGTWKIVHIHWSSAQSSVE